MLFFDARFVPGFLPSFGVFPAFIGFAESEGFEPPKTIRYRKSFILNGYQFIIYVTFAYHLLHLCYANRCKNLSHKVRFRTKRYRV